MFGITNFLYDAAAACVRGYQQSVERVISPILNGNCPTILKIGAAALGTILLESHHALKIGLYSLMGMREKTTSCGLNPEELDEPRSQLQPWLLLHGAFHTQGVWIPFAKAMQKAGIHNPLYTINLGLFDRTLSETKFQKIEEKIRAIKDQYEKQGKTTKVHLVGFSAGGKLAYFAGFRTQISDDIGKIVLLGSVESESGSSNQLPVIEKHHKRVCEIVGSRDLLVGLSSYLPEKQQARVDSGHLELPFKSQAHEKIVEWLLTSPHS